LVADLEMIAKEDGFEAYAKLFKTLTFEQRQLLGKEEHERIKSLALIKLASEDVPQ